MSTMDTINVTPKANGTAALASQSPKLVKTTKTAAPVPSTTISVAYGCEHIQLLLQHNLLSKKTASQQYLKIVQAIEDRHSAILQTYSASSGKDEMLVTCLTPLRLCLQCSVIFTAGEAEKHYVEKGHNFTVDSRTGSLYCAQCSDFIYDPTLEEVRLAKGRKKRKFDEYIGSAEEHKILSANAVAAPCRQGLRGLYNMGNTCFMSVILQSLVHNPFIKAYWLAERHNRPSCESEHCMACSLDDMFTEFYKEEKTEGYGAVNMLLGTWMGSEALQGYSQHDAHEFLQFVLNKLHQENNGTTDPKADDCDCIIHNTFSGKLQSTVTCDKCKNVTTALDPFMDLSLELKIRKKKKGAEDPDAAPVDPRIDLQDCLERFTGKERLAATDYTCQKCASSQAATKQLSAKRLPPVLVIHLKRFEQQKSTSTKIATPVKFPLLLDMYPYTSLHKRNPKATLNTNPPPSLIYELSSVVVHKGNIDSGHYVSFSREGTDWFEFDDSKVVLSSEAEVLGANAYILMYVVGELEGVSRKEE